MDLAQRGHSVLWIVLDSSQNVSPLNRDRTLGQTTRSPSDA